MPLSDQQRRRLSCHISTNLEVIAIMTDAQKAALLRVLEDSVWTEVRVTRDSLSNGWLLVECQKPYSYTLGISPEGSVHS